jgi:site-specific recombinase XerD
LEPIASAQIARHTCAAELIRKGVSVTTVQRLLRHSNSKETMSYVHLTGRAVDDELDSIRWE